MAAKLPDSEENLKAKEPSWLLPAKIAVVVMGIMIIVGLGVIAYTIATRIAGSGEAEENMTAQIPAPASVGRVFGNVAVTVPRGATLGAAEFDAGRMILQMTLADGTVRLLVLDHGTGTELGTIDLVPEEKQ